MSDFRLRVFREAAKCLNFTKAAELLYISQPAVTRHIKELEAEYGLRLFERAGGKLMLTVAGERLLRHADRIVEHYEQLAYDMNHLLGKSSGLLRVGASTTIASYILPNAFAGFATQYPDIKLSLWSANTQEIERMLLAHEVDLGFVEGIPQRHNLNYTSWLKDELVGIVRADSTYAHSDEVTLEQLRQMPLVLREYGSGTLAVCQQALREHNSSINDFSVIAHLGSTETIKRFLCHYDAMGIVSIRSVRNELLQQRFKIIDIKGMSLKRDFYIVQRIGQERGPADDFLRYVHSIESDL